MVNIKFKGEFDRSTLFKAVRLAKRPTGRNMLIRIGIAIFLIGMYIDVFLVFAGGGDLSVTLGMLFSDARHLIAVFLALCFVFLPFIAAYVSASQLWKQPEMHTPVSGTVSSTGITFTSSPARKEIEWQVFIQQRAEGDLIVLLRARGKLSIFQRDFFETQADWDKFKEWVDLNVTKDT